MTRRGIHRLLGLALAVAVLLAFAPAARADGDAPRPPRRGPGAEPPPGEDPVARLTPGELAALQRKLPDWADMDPVKRQHIARHVLRMRSLTDEQRERFADRVKRFEDFRRARAERDPGRQPLHALLGRALGQVLAEDLPEEIGAQLRARRIRGGVLERAFLQRLMRHMVERGAQDVVTGGLDAVPGLARNDAERARLEDLRERAGGEGDAARGARRKLGFHVVRMRFHALQRDAHAATQGDRRAFFAALGERVRAAWKDDYEATLAEVKAKPAEFLRQLERPSRRGTGALRPDELVGLFWTLERLAGAEATGADAGRSELGGLADRMQRLVLEKLGIPADQIEALPARGERARSRELRRLLREHGPRRSSRRGLPGRGLPGQKGPRRGPPPPDGPHGAEDDGDEAEDDG